MSIVRHCEISVPLLPGWSDGTQVVLLRNPVDNFRANVVMSNEPIAAGETLDSFVFRAKAGLKKSLEDYSLEHEGPVQYGSWIGYKVEHSLIAGEKKLKQMQFYTLYQSKCYIITFTDFWRNFDLTKKEAERIISQLELN